METLTISTELGMRVTAMEYMTLRGPAACLSVSNPDKPPSIKASLLPGEARRLHTWLGHYLESFPDPDAKG